MPEVIATNRHDATPNSDIRPLAIIRPTSSSWNDFGLRLMVALTVINEAGERLELSGDVKLYIQDQADSSGYLRAMDGSQAITNGRINDLPFLLLLGTRENYRRLLSHVGDASAVALLLQMRDAAFLQWQHPDDGEFLSLSSQQNFQEAMLRGSEAYLAFIDFERTYNEFAHGELGPITKFVFPETVSGDRQVLELSFAPDAFGSNRTNVFIGPNGAGKTRLLIDLASHALGNSPLWDQWVVQGGEHDPLGLPSNVVVLTHEPYRWTDIEQLGARVQSISIHGQSWTGITRDLSERIRAAEAEDRNTSWQTIARILRHDIPIDGLHLPLRNGELAHWTSARANLSARSATVARELDTNRPPVFLDSNGNALALSSGQKALFVFLVRLFSNLSRRGMVIVDEPETHLHPTFIGKLMRALSVSIEAKEAAAVVATHSPYVVRHVPRECVTVLRRTEPEEEADESSGVEFLYPTFQTRGGDVEQISEFVFEVDSTDVPLLEEQIAGYLRSNHLVDRQTLTREVREQFGPAGVRIAGRLWSEAT